MREIWRVLGTKRKAGVGMLIILMLASGAAEVISLGAIIPVMTVLGDQEDVQYSMQNLRYHGINIASEQLILLYVALFAVTVVGAAIVRVANLWTNQSLSHKIGSDISCIVFQKILNMPYQEHVSRNSANLINSTTKYISETIHAINATMQMITAIIVSVGLIVGLLLVNWRAAIASAIFFGSIYVILAKTTGNELRKNGRYLADAFDKELQMLRDVLGGIREVNLYNCQEFFEKEYMIIENNKSKYAARNGFLSLYPRYLMEAMGLLCLIVVATIVILQTKDNVTILPILGAVALGAQKLLPSLQQIYSGWATIKGSKTAMTYVVKLMIESRVISYKINNSHEEYKTKDKINEIKLSNVCFRYDETSNIILDNVNLRICKGSRIGLVGKTGAGKSTLVDLLAGLLTPTRGSIFVNGTSMNAMIKQGQINLWREKIAYVSQREFYFGKSIKENIALGVGIEEIDQGKVEKAAEMTKLASFIEGLPEQYGTVIGENGTTLSGGQRQRLGIARALYKDSDILIFDESTSALDQETEDEIISAIKGISEDKIMLIIAHQRRILEICDTIYEIKDGSLSKKVF